MRKHYLGILLLIVGGLTAGCDSKEALTANDPKVRVLPVDEREQAKEETIEAAQALRGYAWAKKAEFVANMKKELADIQAGIDHQAAKADRASGKIKEEVKVAIEGMRSRWAQAIERLKAAESAEEDRWEEVKGGFAKAYDELKDSVKKTRQWWKETDAT